jgi:hypothetical protein
LLTAATCLARRRKALGRGPAGVVVWEEAFRRLCPGDQDQKLLGWIEVHVGTRCSADSGLILSSFL